MKIERWSGLGKGLGKRLRQKLEATTPWNLKNDPILVLFSPCS